MDRMANFCIRFQMTPETYYSLSVSEVAAFWKAVTPKTDLRGLI
jgi:hypothetical protein